MKKLSNYISEQFLISDDVYIQSYDYHPTSHDELVSLIRRLLDENKDKEKVVDLNNIDTSKIRDFSFIFNNRSNAIKIDISHWETQKAMNMNCMFAGCINLQSVGDLSDWNVKSVRQMKNMFSFCKNLKDVGDIEHWDVNPNLNADNAFSKSGLKVPSWAQK